MLNAIRKKAQEVSFVLIKVAGFIRRKELSSRVESVSYAIVEALYAGNMAEAVSKIDSAIGLCSLANNVGDISAQNFTILSRELENLKNGINQLKAAEEVREHPSIEGLFSKAISSPARDNPANRQEKPVQAMRQSQPMGFSSQQRQDGDNPAKRYSDILNKVRESKDGRVQLKDLIAAFPNVSERTLRYDLLKMCQSGSLAREGNGGPSNFYVIPKGGVISQEISSSVNSQNAVMNLS